jgi:predicted porin
MKKSLLALAALTAFAGAASAQSSVTLFGIVDLNLRNQDNGSAGSRKTMSTDGMNSSRLGFRGVEDLGGGMKAGFWIEGGLAADVGNQGGGNGIPGAAAAMWNRRATVSLNIGPSEIRLGRDYTPTFWSNTAYDVFGTNGVGAATNYWSALGSNAVTQVRANNTVAYHLNAAGLWVWLQIAPGENQPGQKYTGGRVNYAAGPFGIAVAAGKTDTGNTPDFKEFNVAGSFDAGFAKFVALYGKNDYGNDSQKRWTVQAQVPIGAALLRASYAKADGNKDIWDATQIAVGVIYDLSKRTSLYGTYAKVDNGGSATTGARFTTSGSGPAFTKGGESSTGYEFGIKHSF